jgi:ribosomal protein L11
MDRKTETKKPLTSQKHCPFNFTFKYSNATISWFLKGITSCASHGSHASKTKACTGGKTGELTTKQCQAVADCAEASGNPRTTRKIMKFKSGIKLTHQQLSSYPLHQEEGKK